MMKASSETRSWGPTDGPPEFWPSAQNSSRGKQLDQQQQQNNNLKPLLPFLQGEENRA